MERRELPRLVREEGMITQAAVVKVDRQDDKDRILELEAEIDVLKEELKTPTQSTP